MRIGKIAFRLGQDIQESRFKVLAENARQLNGAGGVLNDLDRFKPGDFVEKPAATGVHQQSVALHFQKAQDVDLFLSFSGRTACCPKKRSIFSGRAIQNDADVSVARGPRVAEEVPALGLVAGGQFIPQPVKRIAERLAPFLVPIADGRRSCSRNPAPTAHAVRTTPGAGLVDLRFGGGRMFFQIFAHRRSSRALPSVSMRAQARRPAPCRHK